MEISLEAIRLLVGVGLTALNYAIILLLIPKALENATMPLSLETIFNEERQHVEYSQELEVDTTGRVILLTTTKEHAELKRDQIHGFGKDFLLARSKGPMSAIIEPAED